MIFLFKNWGKSIGENKLTIYLTLTFQLPWVTKTEFSLQYQYNINQTSDENKENYQVGDN